MELPFRREQIGKIIPHQGFSIFIDEVVSLDPGKSATAKTTFPKDSPVFAPIFKGHFPNYPVLMGVLLLEALAQTGAICVNASPHFRGKLLFLRNIRNCDFNGLVRPGEEIILDVRVESISGNRGTGIGEARVRNKVVCKATISFVALRPRKAMADQR